MEDPYPRQWTRAGLEQICAGGRVSQRWVCHGRKHWPLLKGLPDALRFLLSVLALPDQALHAERLLDARGRAGSPGAGKDVPSEAGGWAAKLERGLEVCGSPKSCCKWL